MDNVPLFDRNKDGLLMPVSRDDAGIIGRRYHRVHMLVEVLFTPEEEAARDAEERAALAAVQPESLSDKLARVGISMDELKAELKK